MGSPPADGRLRAILRATSLGSLVVQGHPGLETSRTPPEGSPCSPALRLREWPRDPNLRTAWQWLGLRGLGLPRTRLCGLSFLRYQTTTSTSPEPSPRQGPSRV